MDIKRITELANQGNAKAQYELGNLYFEGKVVKQDYNRALAWLNRASEQELGEASNLIANMYHFGHGVKKDTKTAGMWFNKAINQGFYIDSSNVSVNVTSESLQKVALDALEKAKQGDIPAMKLLASIYRKREPAEAAKWLHKAADQGDAESQNELGIMYYAGQGVCQNSIIALRWFTLAAEQGDAVGQYNLGTAKK